MWGMMSNVVVSMMRSLYGLSMPSNSVIASTTSLQTPSTMKAISSVFLNFTSTLANTPLTFNVTAGHAYSLYGVISTTVSVTADGWQMFFGGGTANVASSGNSIIAEIFLDVSSPPIVIRNSTGTVFSTTSQVAGSPCSTRFTGFFGCASSGTFVLQAAQFAHTTGLMGITQNSFIALTDIGTF